MRLWSAYLVYVALVLIIVGLYGWIWYQTDITIWAKVFWLGVATIIIGAFSILVEIEVKKNKIMMEWWFSHRMNEAAKEFVEERMSKDDD